MNEVELLRAAVPDPGEPDVAVTTRHRGELRRAVTKGRHEIDRDGRPYEPNEPAPQLPHADGHRRRPGTRRPVLVALVLSLVLALAVGGTVAVLRSNDASDQPADDNTPADPDGLFGDRRPIPADPNAEPLFLVPTRLPDGFQLVAVTGGGHPGGGTTFGGSPGVIQRWVRLDEAHERPAENLSITWGPGIAAIDELLPGMPSPSTEPRDDLLEGYRADSVPMTVRGRDGLYSERNGWLVWEEPTGQVVNVSAREAPEGIERPFASPLPLEFLQAVAESLELRDGGGFDLPSPPDGFEFAAEFPGLTSVGTDARSVTYRGPFERGVRIQMVDDSDSPPGSNFYFSSARLTEVRGRPALLTPFLNGGDGEGSGANTLFMGAANLFLQWLEPDGTRVTISGVALSEFELRTIAESLEPVDQPTWFGLQDQAVVYEPGLPEPTGPPPADEDAARQQVTDTFVAALSSDTSLDERINLINDSTGVRDAYRDAAQLQPQALADFTVEVHEVLFLSATEAAVLYELIVPSAPAGPLDQERTGRVLLVNGEWKVSRETVCGILGFAQATCQP